MNRRHFLKYTCQAIAGSAMLITISGCIAPLISPTISENKSQAWQCGNCGHLTRSAEDLTNTKCPRCMRQGFFNKITEEELQKSLKE